MKKAWSVALTGLILPLFAGVVAEAVPSTFCFPGNGGTVVVTSPAANPNEILPGAVSDGYNNNTCALTIKTSVTPSDAGTTFNAKSITVQGPSVVPNGPPAPISTNVTIVNTFPNSNVTLQGGDFVKIDQGSIKATNQVKIVCTAANCPVTVTNSELIATTTVTTAVNGGFGGTGGNLQVTANGDFSITTSTFTGGALVKFTSQNGSLTAVCTGGGTSGCKDPTIPPFLSQVIAAKCGNPPQFPCNLGVLTEAEVKDICIPGPGEIFCDGGSKEKDFIAEGLINLENSVMTADHHMVIKSDTGPIKAMGFDLTIAGNGSVTIFVNNCQGGPAPCIDLRNANLDVTGPLSIIVKGGCPASPAISIDLTGATLKGSNGPLPIAGVTVSACSGNGVIAGP
jgi:hypothetical protein